MHDRVVIEQYHLTIFIPRGLRVAEVAAVRRTLGGLRFRTALRRATAAIVRRHPALARASVTLTR